MPTRRPNADQPKRDAEPARLTVRRADLAKKLAARIKLGKQLLSCEDLQEIQEKYFTWDEYNTTLLRSSFTTPEESDSYRSFFGIGWSDDPATRYSQVSDDIRSSIRRLESLKERLPLFEEEVASAKTATRQAQGHTSLSDTEPAIFLVHGRDEGAKHGVASSCGISPEWNRSSSPSNQMLGRQSSRSLRNMRRGSLTPSFL
jgi:hypothetical protein